MAHSKASPERVNASLMRLEALELRKQGFTYAVIAESLEVSLSTAYQYVIGELDRLLKEQSESASAVQKLELERLDSMLNRLWPDLDSERPGTRQGAVDRLIRLMERRARLLGLDSPVRLVTSDEEPQDEFL